LSTAYKEDHFAFEMPFLCKPSTYFLSWRFSLSYIFCQINIDVHFFYLFRYSSWSFVVVVILDNRQISIQPWVEKHTHHIINYYMMKSADNFDWYWQKSNGMYIFLFLIISIWPIWNDWQKCITCSIIESLDRQFFNDLDLNHSSRFLYFLSLSLRKSSLIFFSLSVSHALTLLPLIVSFRSSLLSYREEKLQ